MKFLLLTTGGTIASVASEQGLAPALSGEKLLEACPLLMGFEHDLEIVDVFSKDSSIMHPQDWLTLQDSVRRGERCDAVVVLHGTDTLAWTSAALSYLLHDVAVPVVLTGSMLPPGEPGSDAPENIYAAFQFALQLALYKRRGVSAAFADLLIHGPRVTKIDSRRKKAFASVDYPLLGEMKDKGGHKVAWLTPHIPVFSGSGQDFWGTPTFETNIALVPIFPGMRAASLDAILASGPKAVVLEAYGLGGVPWMHESLLEPIGRGIASGIPVVLRTQSPFGGTDPSIYEVGLKALALGALSAGDMTREALTVKLMLLLPRFQGKELAERLRTNLCDDVTN